MQLIIVTIACLTLAVSSGNSATFGLAGQRPFSLPQADNHNSFMVPSDSSLPTLAELSLHSDQADRIRSAMTRFLSQNRGTEPEVRIRTRSAPNAPEIDMFDLISTIEADHEKDQRSDLSNQVALQQQQQEQQLLQQQAAAANYKKLRNSPVYIRLPSRFGKRSISRA